jgi:hypothetical protein
MNLYSHHLLEGAWYLAIDVNCGVLELARLELEGVASDAFQARPPIDRPDRRPFVHGSGAETRPVEQRKRRAGRPHGANWLPKIGCE